MKTFQIALGILQPGPGYTAQELFIETIADPIRIF
jgi:hypothetical protein